VWPVGLLTIAYPVAATRMAGHTVGGVPLATFLLAASLTVPWLSQGVCMPLYRVLGELNGSADQADVRRRFCAAWPATFARALPLAVLTAVPLFLALRWSLTAVASFVVLVGLHLALVQGLVPANAGRARAGWAVAWTAYAAALLLAPSIWFLPPLVALLTQLVPLRRDLLVRPVWRVHHAERTVVADVLRGLLLGSVLWGDKLFYFVRSDGAFPVTTVFLALLPAVLAYNYFFASMAPRIDAAVESLRTAMQEQTLTGLAPVSRALARRVSTSVRRTALVGAALSLVAATILTATSPATAALVAAVCVASWCFMMLTLLCYQLDYIGDRVGALGSSAVHLALTAAAFACLPAGAPAYAALAIAELALLALVLRRCLCAWSVPEYNFFWRRALSW
jgi:hypothetical protein